MWEDIPLSSPPCAPLGWGRGGLALGWAILRLILIIILICCLAYVQVAILILRAVINCATRVYVQVRGGGGRGAFPSVPAIRKSRKAQHEPGGGGRLAGCQIPSRFRCLRIAIDFTNLFGFSQPFSICCLTLNQSCCNDFNYLTMACRLLYSIRETRCCGPHTEVLHMFITYTICLIVIIGSIVAVGEMSKTK